MKKKKVLIILVISVISLFLIFNYVLPGLFINMLFSGKPDTSSWVLENNEFTVVPTVEKTVSFYIEDKQGNIVYESDEWRSWDFKTLNIDEKNNVIVYTGDMGIQTFSYNGETWIEQSE